MKVDVQEIREIADRTGFLGETIEKVIRLTEILSGIRSHPFLSGKMVLKGGTAIHIFWLGGKRLSVDLDLNYVGSSERDAMLKERPIIEKSLQQLCVSLGYSIKRIPSEHAGGKWRMGYLGILGQPQSLELDINYIYRIPIWGIEEREITFSELTEVDCRFPILHPLELWAGKIVAAIVRAEPRDLFDLLFLPESIAGSKDLKRTVTLIGSAARSDWREMKLDHFERSPQEIQERLFPVIRSDEKIDWPRLGQKARHVIEPFLRFNKEEKLYLDLIQDQGDYRPEILFPEPEMKEKLSRHPVLLWKAHNRRQQT